jgi:hypothetical protein
MRNQPFTQHHLSGAAVEVLGNTLERDNWHRSNMLVERVLPSMEDDQSYGEYGT